MMADIEAETCGFFQTSYVETPLSNINIKNRVWPQFNYICDLINTTGMSHLKITVTSSGSFIITVIIIIIIIIIITKGIYNYIPKSNHTSMIYSVAAVLCLQFMLHVTLLPMLNLLYIHVSTTTMCAVPSTADCIL